MATRDITSDLEPYLALKNNIAANTVTYGVAFDMSDYDDGYMFVIKATNWVDGTFALSLQDSPTTSVWTDVPSNKLINPDGDAPSIAEATVLGDQLKRLGAFSTERYVRAAVTSTGVTTGGDIEVYMVKKPEIKPAQSY